VSPFGFLTRNFGPQKTAVPIRIGGQ
jgi:hypothetical protein